MLCSAPAQKSGLNWLDRLRFNKGIPTGDDLDLDSFLANHSNPTSSDSSHSISEPTRPSKIRSRSSEISAADARPRLSSVLADLLNMGGRLSSGKKCPRKQTNPKFFVASSLSNSNTGIVDCARKDDIVPATKSFSNDTAKLQEEGLDCCDVEEEKENDGNELRGFFKSEVTVIDTSCPGRSPSLWSIKLDRIKRRFYNSVHLSLRMLGFLLLSYGGTEYPARGEKSAMTQDDPRNPQNFNRR
ncbi:hypothetical protein K1719_025314 [Acacia pycnantha]|nr:hypothetical protein K1719_025314 [Acacia pycnantha]